MRTTSVTIIVIFLQVLFWTLITTICSKFLLNNYETLWQQDFERHPRVKDSEHAKTATASTKIKNYWPLRLLNILSKICERFLPENLTNYVHSSLSKFISGHRKSYSSSHVLFRLIENWKKVSGWEKICWCCFNRLIRGFWLHASWSSHS